MKALIQLGLDFLVGLGIIAAISVAILVVSLIGFLAYLICSLWFVIIVFLCAVLIGFGAVMRGRL
jgi:hypothetical protein